MSSIPFADLSALTDDATARQLAVDPSTPPAELERLLGRGAEIDRALVRHPNVPLHVYRALAPTYPLSACANPAIGRLIEEEPGLIRAIPRLCEQPLCPPSQLGWVARHGSRGQQLAVLRNPAVPDDVRASLTPAHFHNDALRRLESLALAQPTPVRRRLNFCPEPQGQSELRPTPAYGSGAPELCSACTWASPSSSGAL